MVPNFWDRLLNFVMKIVSPLRGHHLTILLVTSLAERNLGILKKLLKKSACGGDDFVQKFFALKNLPHTTGGLSPARLFFQREVRVPMFYTPPCHKDEYGAGMQRHYDRERQREVRNAKRGKGLASPLELYVSQHVFLQDELRKGHPYSIPGKVVSIRENGWSGFVWCPGKACRLLRNRRKMRLRMDDDDDNEDSEESSTEEEVMIDEEEVDLGDDELHDVLSVRAGLPTGTHAAVHQVTSAGAQLPSALCAVQTSPRPVQLLAGGERGTAGAVLSGVLSSEEPSGR